MLNRRIKRLLDRVGLAPFSISRYAFLSSFAIHLLLHGWPSLDIGFRSKVDIGLDPDVQEISPLCRYIGNSWTAVPIYSRYWGYIA